MTSGMVEEILGIIDNVESDRRFDLGRIYSLYFTNNRIIVAKTVGAAKRHLTRWAPGSYHVGRAIAKRFAEKRTAQLSQLSADEILKEDKNNFSIDNATIKVIQLKKPGFLKTGKLRIITNKDEFPFKLMEKHDFDDCVEIVRTAVAEKIAVL